MSEDERRKQLEAELKRVDRNNLTREIFVAMMGRFPTPSPEASAQARAAANALLAELAQPREPGNA